MPKLKFKNGDVVIVPGTASATGFGQDIEVMPYEVTVTARNDESNTYAMGKGGHYSLSSSVGALTASLPDPSTKAGVRYHISTQSSHAHNVTASAGSANGIYLLQGMGQGAPSTPSVGLFKFAATGAGSLILESNGVAWQVVCVSSGSHTYGADSDD